MTGLLRVEGTIDLAQFWPVGGSDADTTKVEVQVTTSSFSYRADGTRTFRKTHVLDEAVVRGRGRTPAIKKLKRAGISVVTVRLQGIDAPELHYAPTFPTLDGQPKPTPAQRADFNDHNHELRQPYGETCTVKLHTKLARSSTGTSLRCRVETAVDEPDEVFDMYGRLIGDLYVTTNRKTPLYVNKWLLEQGWALPAFYNSMSNDEITTLIAAAAKGRAKPGVWAEYSAKVGTLNSNRTYRKEGPYIAANDTGSVIMPKLFRRLANWGIATKFTTYKKLGTFREFLIAKNDAFHTLDDFLAQGVTAAKVENLGNYIVGGKLTLEPEDIVFREEGSTLLDSKGKKITAF